MELERFQARADVEVDGRTVRGGYCLLAWRTRVQPLLDSGMIVPRPRLTAEQIAAQPPRNPVKVLP